ncbi:hypothetical protein ACHQM5_009294 [Ranunculus cassubicifolius]
MYSNVSTINSTHLPQELIIEILSYLPAINLWPLRYVSKFWFQLLTSDHRFIKLHLNRSIQLNNINPSILASRLEAEKINPSPNFYLAENYTACDKAIQLELPFYENGCNYYKVFGICNGLICLSLYYDNAVCIWNPVTNDYIAPPPLPVSYEQEYVFGFGFLQGTNEYKVVSIPGMFVDLTDIRSNVSVLTVGVDDWWRTIEEDFCHRISPHIKTNQTTPFINGACHWLASKRNALSFNLIVAFDLKDEVLQEIQPPNVLRRRGPVQDNVVGELAGLLCVFERKDTNDVHIWVMKEYGVVSSWIKQFVIGRREVSGMFVKLQPLGLVSNGNIILRKNTKELILYNIKNKSISSLRGFGFNVVVACTYNGSIISPRAIGRVRGAGDITI